MSTTNKPRLAVIGVGDFYRMLAPGIESAFDVVVKLFGGQGTINVPSWSPDSARLAFVSYQLIH